VRSRHRVVPVVVAAELTRYLRTGRVIRRPKGVRLPDGRGGRPNTLHISERAGRGRGPCGARSRPLVERDSRFLFLVALPGGNHQAEAVADALAAAITTLPNQLAKTLTRRIWATRWPSISGSPLLYQLPAVGQVMVRVTPGSSNRSSTSGGLSWNAAITS
jgi:hypothetical protein